MNELTADRALPTQHGVERAAARIHQVAKPRESWHELNDSARNYYRSAVAHTLRDLGPDPRAALDLPLLWYSPSWGVLQAEREDFAKGDRNVIALRPGMAVCGGIELPEDAYPLTPIQSRRPVRPLDEVQRPTLPWRAAA